MPRNKSWTDTELLKAVKKSFSYRMVLLELGLIPAGGNYEQIKKRISELNFSVDHFTGGRWNVGARKRQTNFGRELDELLILGSGIQSFKLKNRLFREGIKQPKCELCGWCEVSIDGRIPVELDHKNGNHQDNSLDNLRILCPNCHSLQPTHRGKNKKVRFARVL